VRVPDFFLVGAPKCGTTALFEMLGAHPEIFASPIKEPDFFAADIRAAVAGSKVPASPNPNKSSGGRVFRPGEFVSDWHEYLELFKTAGPGQRIGEGSVSYLASRVAAQAISDRCPAAQILMVLRDPADRLFAHYRAAIASRSIRAGFAEWLGAVVAREKTDPAPIGPVVAGRFGMNVKRYLDVFPPSQIHIVWHEDYVNDPAAVVRGIFAFLGVDSTRDVPVHIRRNETRMKWWMTSALTLTAPDRALAVQVYEEDVHVLERLTGRDLGHWLRPKG